MSESNPWAAEAALWAAFAGDPEDPDVVRGLVAALTARGAAIPPDLEERSLVLQRRELPEDPGLVTAHVAVLLKQGKAVPPELEALSLRQILAGDPDNASAIQALVAVYHRTGQPIPPELEKKSLAIALAERPGDPELLRALAAVEAKHAAPAPAGPPQIIIRSAPKEPPPAAAATLEAALGQALTVRPSDTYLLSLLLGCLIDSGRITPASEPRAVLAQLPPQVQTNEAIVAALLLAAAKGHSTA